MTGVSDFGRYLQSVEERDIDLLLMEEFHIAPDFTSWFAEHVGLGPSVTFDGAWHSLSDQDGETDLLLRVRIEEERVAVLIENKVAAPEQPQQDLRYQIRGQRSQEAGRYDRFTTCICAPEVYLSGVPLRSTYEHQLSYERIRDWFAAQYAPRAQWRRAIMDEAIAQGASRLCDESPCSKEQFPYRILGVAAAASPGYSDAQTEAKGSRL